jgi:hypothetical protein
MGQGIHSESITGTLIGNPFAFQGGMVCSATSNLDYGYGLSGTDHV